MRLVIASSNTGKLREIHRLLEPLGVETIPQQSLGVSDADEPHSSFVENALAKARHASRETGLPALADDSGICVAALNGAPGVLSARFAGEPRSDQRNNDLLLTRLGDIPRRDAFYYCVIVLLRHQDDPRPVIAEGAWHGEIARFPCGSGGFGYDPIFSLPELGKTAAELDRDLKNQLSHRGTALRQLADKLRSAL